MFARHLTPPYYAVIFASTLADDDGYERTAQHMSALAEGQPGYLGLESIRGTDGFGITVSYWESEGDIARWKSQAEHFAAQEEGITRFYEHYELRVARVDRAYSGPEGRRMNKEEEEKS